MASRSDQTVVTSNTVGTTISGVKPTTRRR